MRMSTMDKAIMSEREELKRTQRERRKNKKNQKQIEHVALRRFFTRSEERRVGKECGS